MDEDRRHDLDPVDPPSEDDGFDFLTAPFDAVEGTVEPAASPDEDVVADVTDEPAEVEAVEDVEVDVDDDAVVAPLALAPPPVAHLVSVPSEPEQDLEPEQQEPELAVEPEPEVHEPVALVPDLEPDPVLSSHVPMSDTASDTSSDPASDAASDPASDPASDAASDAEVEAAPVAGYADLLVRDVEPDEELQTSIWKKEISFGRKKEPKAPSAEKESRKPRRERPAAVVAAEAVEEPKSTPFWKKEISLGGKPKVEAAEPAADVVAETPAVEAEQVEKPVSFWKKEISFGGGKKEPKPAKAPKKPKKSKKSKQDEPEIVAETPAVEAEQVEKPVPFWKKEISFGGGKKEPKPAKAPKKPKKSKQDEPEVVAEAPAVEAEQVEKPVPFWKKEISFGGSKAERAERPRPAKRERPSRAPRAEAVAEQPTQDVAPVEAAEPVAAEPVAAEPVAAETPAPEEAPTEERVPFYKRERTPRAPRGRRPAPKPRRAKAEAVAPEETKEETTPRRARPPRRGAAAAPRAERTEAPTSKPAAKGAPKRHKKLVGLKIGASQIAAAHIVNNGHAELVKVAREPLDEGVITGGELRDPDALTLALKSFFNKHKLPKRGVRLGIANNRIGVRTFEIAGIDDEKQLANAIRFRAQEALPIPIEEAVLDWRILSEGVDDEGQKTRRILLVVAYRELIDRYVDACMKAGVKLVGIDLEAFALLRALGGGERRGSSDGALVAVSVGHERSTFAVSDGVVCEFTRVLEWGGHSLNVAIARALEKTPTEVEDVKLGLSLDDTPEELPLTLSQEDADKAREAVRRQLQTFARELVSSLQFYQNQPGSLGIGEVVLTGGTTQLPGLAQELERLVGVRVRIGDPLSRVKTPKSIDEDGLASLSVAIGLGIED